MIFQVSSFIYIVSRLENLKKFQIKHKELRFLGFALQTYLGMQYFILFKIENNGSQAVPQKIFKRNVFRKTLSFTHYLSH